MAESAFLIKYRAMTELWPGLIMWSPARSDHVISPKVIVLLSPAVRKRTQYVSPSLFRLHVCTVPPWETTRTHTSTKTNKQTEYIIGQSFLHHKPLILMQQHKLLPVAGHLIDLKMEADKVRLHSAAHPSQWNQLGDRLTKLSRAATLCTVQYGQYTSIIFYKRNPHLQQLLIYKPFGKSNSQRKSWNTASGVKEQARLTNTSLWQT